jgi:ribonucleoside-diphosphate reductase alpha chain
MNTYQTFISKARYARFIPEIQRREDWEESADRWIDFMQWHVEDKFPGKLPPNSKTWDMMRNAIKKMDSLPSMRGIMTAGEALRRSNVAAYNCSYLPVDDPRSFDEAMYILLCGTGVGFSVEQKYVDKLPVIQTLCETPHIRIVVPDSKEGWCESYRALLEYLWQGHIPSWDVSGVRPKGAPLKTFGGRASGPEPLVELFKFTIEKFKERQGHKLRPIDAHDIMCKIGDIVVVGGVRRSAMISLGDLGDYEHANAKSGEWWTHNGHRRLANNSAVYNERPTVGEFMKEWLSIYNSHSGERGIFNREASRNQAHKYGRLLYADYGTNPCSEIILRPYQFCNLSTVVARHYDTLETLKKKVAMAAMFGTLQSTLLHFPYLRDIWYKNTEKERLLGVSITGILDCPILRGGVVDLEAVLPTLRNVARETNEYWADYLGIPRSKAVTCVKPEGTVSQLTLSASGIHPDHAPYYIRRVRQDWKDPLTNFLVQMGVPYENCVHDPDNTCIFSFPMEAKGFTKKDLTAIQHLELWLKYQRFYCEHKPSVTITVKEHEWPEVGAWVWEHFDECTGISFLPDDGGTYQQAPYEEITKEKYDLMLKAMPTIDWHQFVETEDNVEGAQTLACTAGGCAI